MILRRRRALGVLAVAAITAGCGRDQSRGVAADGGPSGGASSAVPADARIVTVGGTVTEVAFALGEGARIVAVDTSSLYPPEVRALPQVGYQRTLAAEGIASQRPTILLLSDEAGPPAVIDQLRGLGARMEIFASEPTIDAAKARIRRIAATLGVSARGDAIVDRLSAEVAEAEALVRRVTRKTRVLFVYARGGGTLMVSGPGTPADAMIRLAGGENVISDFKGFKPLTAEAVTTAAPEVILMPERGLASIGGEGGLLAQPGVALTPAGAARRIVAMDDLLLLGFGPRLGQAIRALAARLHPELAAGSP